MPSELYQKCCDLYHEKGYGAVFDFVKDNHPEVPWAICEPCELITPFEEDDCLVCGSHRNSA